MTVRILHGDCRDVLKTLPDESVHCVVTSPPYFGLRDYGTASWSGGDPNCDHSRKGRCADPKNPSAADCSANGRTPRGEELNRQSCRCGAIRIDKQLGLEESPEAFVTGMVEVFREVRRVLRNDGTLWLNIGDSYASDAGGYDDAGSRGASAWPSIGARTQAAVQKGRGRKPQGGVKVKDLYGIPWMLAFALRADGWYLRQDIIWHKPNPMPESVRDRCTKSHEYLFLLSKSARYYYDKDAIAEPAAYGNTPTGVGFGHGYDADLKPRVGNRRPAGWADSGSKSAIEWATEKAQGRGSKRNSFARETKESIGEHGQTPQHRPGREDVDYAGTRNKRSVWSIPTAPFAEAHFATFPPALVEPCILAGTSAHGCCSSCGAPWVRSVEREFVPQPDVAADKVARGHDDTKPLDASNGWTGVARGTTTTTTTGWEAGCECAATVVPCTVLDPFGGAGTTGLVADRLQRDAILIELNPAYAAMADRRIRGDSPLFAETAA